MKHRWWIRGFLLGLCTLCVVAWVGSYLRFVGISQTTGLTFRTIAAENGSVSIFWDDGHGILFDDWHLYNEPTDFFDTDVRYSLMEYHFAGFAFPRTTMASPGVSMFLIPLWFLTLLSSLVLWFGWRKTRGPVRGFPVEKKGRGQEDSGESSGGTEAVR